MREEAGASHLSELKIEYEMLGMGKKSMKTQESWPLLQTGLNVVRESKDCNTSLTTPTHSWHGPLCASPLSIWCLAMQVR